MKTGNHTVKDVAFVAMKVIIDKILVIDLDTYCEHYDPKTKLVKYMQQIY